MKIHELKQELLNKSLKVSGSKQELLERLGVPTGFGETSLETLTRETNELLKKRKVLQQQQMHKNKKSKLLSPADDPSHEEYTLKCCNTPRFENNSVEPAGAIFFRDGSLMEVWRCMNCHKIPQMPNAPPIEEFSDHSDDDELVVVGGGAWW
jgi:hypothetical protein